MTDLEKLGQRTFFLDCDVIQADGGTRTALSPALHRHGAGHAPHDRVGHADGPPIRDYFAATSVDIVDGEIMLDLATKRTCAPMST